MFNKILAPWQSFFEHFQDLRVEFFGIVRFDDSESPNFPAKIRLADYFPA
jgi:hypothetical protein